MKRNRVQGAESMMSKWRFPLVMVGMLVFLFLGNVCRGAADVPAPEEPLDLPRLFAEIDSLRNSGRQDEATACARKTADAARVRFGDAHPDFASALERWGGVLSMGGNEAQAEAFELFHRALTIYEKALGKSDPRLIGCVFDLGVTHQRLLRYGEAESCLRRALELGETAWGNEHPKLSGILRTLASLLLQQKRDDLALPLLEREYSIRVKHPEMPAAGQADVLNLLGGLLGRRKEHVRAEDFYRKELEIRERNPGLASDALALVLFNLGETLWFNKAFDQAEAFLQRAVALEEKLKGPQHPRLAFLLTELGFMLNAGGKAAAAEGHFKRALEIGEKTFGSDHANLVSTLNFLGKAFADQGKMADAESCYSRALSIAEQQFGKDSPRAAIPLANLAAHHYSRKKFPQAEALYRRALKLKEAQFGLNHLEIIVPLVSLAHTLFAQRIYDEAEILYRRSLQIREQVLGKDHVDVAKSLISLGGYLFSIRPAQAEALFLRALEIQEKALGPDHLEVANTLERIGQVYGNDDRTLDKAEPYFRRAIDIREKKWGKGSDPNINLAYLLIDRKRFEEAEDIMRKVLDGHIKKSGRVHYEVARSLDGLGHLFYRWEKYDKAEPFFREAIEIWKQVEGPFSSAVAGEMDYLAAAYQKMGRFEPALATLQETMGLYEKAAEAAGWEEVTEKFRRIQKGICMEFCECLYELEKSDPARALPYREKVLPHMEISRAREFLAQLQASSAGRAVGLSGEELRREQALDDRLHALEERSRLERSKSAGKVVSASLLDLEAQLAEGRLAKKALESEFAAKYPRYATLRHPPPPDVGFLQKQVLATGECVLSFWEGREHLFAHVLTPERADFLVQPISTQTLHLDIAQFRQAMDQQDDPESFKPLSLALYRKILEPFLKTTDLNKISALYVVPHGSLQSVPFEALVLSDRGETFKELDFLFRKVPVAYIPSVQVLATIRQDLASGRFTREERDPAILFGNPLYEPRQLASDSATPDAGRGLIANVGASGTLSVLAGLEKKPGKKLTRALRVGSDGKITLVPLPGSRLEVEGIAAQFYAGGTSSHTYLAGNAREGMIKELSRRETLKKYRFLHLAAHGILPGEVEGLVEPCIALSLFGDADEDGFLKMGEIFGLKLDADAVVLSACQTGLDEDPARGQGISGLSRAFFFAGTPRILVSLWSISDKGTCEFMLEFYRQIRDRAPGSSFLQALNRTREAMLAGEFDHPFYWAPFVLIGEWR
jgi:CHAT domain-containing protein/tetratricopeptide (TPR) repeat protein